MAAEVHPGRGRGFSVGYVIVLLGAALFVTGCFLPYYRFPGGHSLSLYDQLSLSQDGGLELSAILFLFGGVATVVVVAMVGLTRGERQSGRGFLAGAVSAWSLTWICCFGPPASAKRPSPRKGSHWWPASGCRPWVSA